MSNSSLATIYNFALTNTQFQQQCLEAAITAAVAVSTEPPGTKSAAQIGKRSLFATRVLQAPQTLAQTIAIVVTSNTTISAEISANPSSPTIPDGDVQFAVNSLWNALSGVTTTENTG